MVVMVTGDEFPDKVYEEVWATTPPLPTRLPLNLFVLNSVVNVVEFRYAEFRSQLHTEPIIGQGYTWG